MFSELPPKLVAASKEVMRHSQKKTTPAHLSKSLCMLLRVTALTCPDPRKAVNDVAEQLRPFVADLHILEGITGRVLEALGGKDLSREVIEPELDTLMDEVREAEIELAEQTSTMLSASDTVVLLAERKGSFLEAALCDAAETITDTDPTAGLAMTVRIIRVAPDHDGVADAMHERLRDKPGLHASVVQDANMASALVGATKVFLAASGLDVDDGALCEPGSGILCAAANRMRVPVIVVCPRHRITPMGCAAVGMAGLDGAPPGQVWAYEESRADRQHEPVQVVAFRYDIVALQKCDIVVTEYGGYAPEYMKSIAPNVNGAALEEEAQQ